MAKCCTPSAYHIVSAQSLSSSAPAHPPQRRGPLRPAAKPRKRPLTANQLWQELDVIIENAVMIKQHLRQGDREDVRVYAGLIVANAEAVAESARYFKTDHALRLHCQHK